ncbi:MAG: hypothetical protein RRZ24_09640 [Clostridia bacterium]
MEEDKKKKRKSVLMILGITVGVICVAICALLIFDQQQSKYVMDATALKGFLPGKTQEQIEAELNRIVKAGELNVSLNRDILVIDGVGNVSIENTPNNNYWIRVDITLKDQGDDSKPVYSSGMISQGFYIEKAPFTGDVPAGTHEAIATITAHYPETEEVMGMVNVEIYVTGKLEV